MIPQQLPYFFLAFFCPAGALNVWDFPPLNQSPSVALNRARNPVFDLIDFVADQNYFGFLRTMLFGFLHPKLHSVSFDGGSHVVHQDDDARI